MSEEFSNPHTLDRRHSSSPKWPMSVEWDVKPYYTIPHRHYNWDVRPYYTIPHRHYNWDVRPYHTIPYLSRVFHGSWTSPILYHYTTAPAPAKIKTASDAVDTRQRSTQHAGRCAANSPLCLLLHRHSIVVTTCHQCWPAESRHEVHRGTDAVHISLCLSVCLSVCVSVCVSVCLSVCLSYEMLSCSVQWLCASVTLLHLFVFPSVTRMCT